MFRARHLLEIWTAKAKLRQQSSSIINDEKELIRIGRELLSGAEKEIVQLDILGENMEKSDRRIVILKAHKSYHAYADMIHYYAVKNLIDYLKTNSSDTFASICKKLKGSRQTKWTNLGGQLIPEKDVDQIRSNIGSGMLAEWEDIHNRYNTLWQQYPLEKQKHAFASLCALLGTDDLTREQWDAALDRAVTIQEFIRDQVYISRKKDYDNTFRQNTYRNMAEMTAAVGTIEDNSFIKQVRSETEEFKKHIEEIKKQK
jgi:hypothetical protein